jgi:hypothetical protein
MVSSWLAVSLVVVSAAKAAKHAVNSQIDQQGQGTICFSLFFLLFLPHSR